MTPGMVHLCNLLLLLLGSMIVLVDGMVATTAMSASVQGCHCCSHQVRNWPLLVRGWRGFVVWQSWVGKNRGPDRHSLSDSHWLGRLRWQGGQWGIMLSRCRRLRCGPGIHSIGGRPLTDILEALRVELGADPVALILADW